MMLVQLSKSDNYANALTWAAILRQKKYLSAYLYGIIKNIIFGSDLELLSLMPYNNDIVAEKSNPRDLNRLVAKIKDCAIKYLEPFLENIFSVFVDDAHIISNAHNHLNESCLVYGEVEFNSFAEILDFALSGLLKRNKFVDLGHGTGKALVIAGALYDFETLCGCEIIEGLYEISQTAQSQFIQQSYSKLLIPPNLSLTFGSFLNQTFDWSDANLVFANSTCFTDDIFKKIESRACQLEPGARVITLTLCFQSPSFEIILKKRVQMSWGSTTVYVHERRADAASASGSGSGSGLRHEDDSNRCAPQDLESVCSSVSFCADSIATAGRHGILDGRMLLDADENTHTTQEGSSRQEGVGEAGRGQEEASLDTTAAVAALVPTDEASDSDSDSDSDSASSASRSLSSSSSLQSLRSDEGEQGTAEGVGEKEKAGSGDDRSPEQTHRLNSASGSAWAAEGKHDGEGKAQHDDLSQFEYLCEEDDRSFFSLESESQRGAGQRSLNTHPRRCDERRMSYLWVETQDDKSDDSSHEEKKRSDMKCSPYSHK